MNQRIDENGDIEQYVSKLNELFQKLLALSNEIKPEFFMSATLLGSLPSSYDNLITALEARNEDDLTSAFVRSKIIEEYRRRKERDGHNIDSTVLKVTYNQIQKSSCKFCKKPGHVQKDCHKFTKWLENKRNRTDANLIEQSTSSYDDVLFVVGKMDGWILDSGATCHISCCKNLFETLNIKHREKVSVANGNEVVSSGRGSIIVDFVNDNGVSTKVTICEVL